MKKLVLTTILLFSGFCVFAQNGLGLLNGGIQNLGNGKFKQAIENFRQILLDVDEEVYHPDAYFWLSKTLIAVGDLRGAEKNLEYFLSFYRENKNYPEGVYQKGRLLFLQQEYENAIDVLTGFIRNYADSQYISNAHFWVGESMYELGMWDESIKAFVNIVRSYPSSYKFEAAQYRISLIGLKKREEELIKLVQWSHEENLKTLEEFRRREKGYQNALVEYQQKLALVQGKDLEADVIKLQEDLSASQAQVEALNNRIAQLSGEKEALETSLTTRPEPVQREPLSADQAVLQLVDLLKLKNRALDLKEFYFTLLVEEGINLNE